MTTKNAVAIEQIEALISDLERKAKPLIETVNALREQDGLPPRTPFGGGSGGTSSSADGSTALPAEIKPDTFYGKKMQTAIREYLEMRRQAGSGPATVREIYDAIVSGGYKFEAKSAEIAIIGMRALLRKRSHIFHKLPNATYGMTAWYPDLKKSKAKTADDDDDDEKETATPKKKAAAS